jgi:hypothetical protein
MTRILIPFFAALVLFSCSDEPKTELAVSTISTKDTLISISETGFNLAFVIPKLMLSDESPLIDYNDTRGFLEMAIGENFNIHLIDDSLSLADLRQELLDDQMFTYKFYDEGDHGFTFQQVLPNGQEFYYHFVMTTMIDGKHYFIQSNPDMEFTLKNVKDMKKAMLTLQPT